MRRRRRSVSRGNASDSSGTNAGTAGAAATAVTAKPGSFAASLLASTNPFSGGGGDEAGAGRRSAPAFLPRGSPIAMGAAVPGRGPSPSGGSAAPMSLAQQLLSASRDTPPAPPSFLAGVAKPRVSRVGGDSGVPGRSAHSLFAQVLQGSSALGKAAHASGAASLTRVNSVGSGGSTPRGYFMPVGGDGAGSGSAAFSAPAVSPLYQPQAVRLRCHVVSTCVSRGLCS